MALRSSLPATKAVFVLFTSTDLFSTMDSLLYCKYCLKRIHVSSKYSFLPDDQKDRFLRMRDSNYRILLAINSRNTDRGGQGRVNHLRYRCGRPESLQETRTPTNAQIE